MSYAKNRAKKARRRQRSEEERHWLSMIRRGLLPRWHNTVEMQRHIYRRKDGYETQGIGWKKGTFRLVSTLSMLMAPANAPKEPGLIQRGLNFLKGASA